MMSEQLKETTTASEQLFSGRIIQLYRDKILLPNGEAGIREVVRHPGGVCIVPLTDAGEVILVRQWRYPYGEIVREIPAGKRERGEDPLLCGKRELEEETGYTAQKYYDLGVLYPTPGYVDEVIHCYLACGLIPAKQHLDPDEFLELEYVPLSRLVEQILSGEIKDAKTQIALLKTWLLQQNGEWDRFLLPEERSSVDKKGMEEMK